MLSGKKYNSWLYTENDFCLVNWWWVKWWTVISKETSRWTDQEIMGPKDQPAIPLLLDDDHAAKNDEHSMKNIRKSVRWSAVPVAPMWVYEGVWWWEGKRPRRCQWPMLSKFWSSGIEFEQVWDALALAMPGEGGQPFYCEAQSWFRWKTHWTERTPVGSNLDTRH